MNDGACTRRLWVSVSYQETLSSECLCSARGLYYLPLRMRYASAKRPDKNHEVATLRRLMTMVQKENASASIFIDLNFDHNTNPINFTNLSIVKKMFSRMLGQHWTK